MKIEERASSYMSLQMNDTVNHTGRINETPEKKADIRKPAVDVEISTTALQMSEDEARIERLNAIRRQLAEGTYNISGKDVADKILKVLKS
ncbi:MAG: flagellar biosynthesis anti-sigma factor FlgM [Geobacteraceae bacterium]|nr:flagellar biosynthesis anti-sigma factor FlgM [Geobacteraceae bacterium]